VGGAPLEDQLAERFFGPLGLTRTYDQRGRIPSGPIAHGYRFAPGNAKPIDLSDGTRVVPFTSVITAAGGAGAIASTPTDLVFWARSMYGDGGKPALSPVSRSAMFADVASTAPKKPRIPYGLGLQAVDLDGHLAYGHSGRLLGFRSVVRWLPTERIAIAVLTNTSRTDPAIIARSLLRVALKPSTGCATCRAPL
jgi:D-alanyl-D-alanine carboxypeptidase